MTQPTAEDAATAVAPPPVPGARHVSGYFVGVDLGQAADFTAVAILARRDVHRPEMPDELVRQLRAERRIHAAQGSTGWGALLQDVVRVDTVKHEPPPPAFDVVHLDRLPLNTPYPQVAEHLVRVMARPEIVASSPDGKHRTRPTLVVDATGVGRPVVDLLRQAKLEPVAVTITGGDAVQFDGGGWRVPKRELVAGLQVLLQAGRLRISEQLPHARTLVDELLRFKVKIDPVTAHDSYGAWRDGEHDDVVLATAVAAWYGQRWRRPVNPDEWPTIPY